MSSACRGHIDSASSKALIAPNPAPLALEGITVVSLEQAVAAPFATRQLADLGARVIKIERVGDGDFCRYYDDYVGGLASYFVWLNRTKESLTLDVRTRKGRAILDELLARADVFVGNLSVDAMTRLGCDPESLKTRYPDLIVCSISGYDRNGPQRARRAYDLLVQAETGAVAVTGSPSDAAKVGISIADIAAGMYGFAGVLAALFARQRTGRVHSVDVNLFDALTEWMNQPLYVAAGSGRDPARRGVHHSSIAPYGPVHTRDGAVVIVAVQNPQEWVRFCSTVLDDETVAVDPRYATNVARTANRASLEDRIDTVAQQLSIDEFSERLTRADVPFATLRTPTEALEALRLGRKPAMHVATEVGPIEVFGRPFSLSDVDLNLGRVPSLGEDTDAILGELGRSDVEVEALHDEGVV